MSGSGNFIRHVNRVARVERGVGHVAVPPFAVSFPENGSVGPYNENVFFVGCAGRTAGLTQIPTGALAAAVGYPGRAIDLACYHDEVRLLGNQQRVTWPDFHVDGRVFPFLNRRAYMDQQSATDRNLFELRNQLLALPRRGGAFQPCPAYSPVLQPGYHLITTLGCKFPHLGPL